MRTVRSQAGSGTHVLGILGVIERLGPEDLGAVRRELEAARDGVTELALRFPESALVFSTNSL